MAHSRTYSDQAERRESPITGKILGPRKPLLAPKIPNTSRNGIRASQL